MVIQNPNREIPYNRYESRVKEQVEKEIKSLSGDYIMGVNEDSFINMMTEKYEVHFEVYYGTERLELEGQNEEMDVASYDTWGHVKYRVYTKYYFCLKYKFTGNIDVLKIEPRCYQNSTKYNPTPIEVFGDELRIRFVAYEMDKQKIQKLIGETKANAFCNLEGNGGVIWQMNQFNEKLPQRIRKIFDQVKAQRIKERQVLLDLGVVSSPNASIEVPVIKKIATIPSMTETKEINYNLKQEVCRLILQHIYSLYKGYEKQPSTYMGKHEENLRDLVLPSLNAAFVGMNTSGETFNRSGKTDIITKAPDNSNVFIAECKIWRGEKQLSEAIDQLLSYVTWRDTQTALIVFVKNSEIIEIVEKAKNVLRQHNCYLSKGKDNGESCFSYTFHTMEDEKCKIALELMIFHFPEYNMSFID